MAYVRPIDLPPPPLFAIGERPLHVHLHAKLVEPGALRGGVVIVIDALRASVTITAALANGAERVIPVLSVEEARAEKQRRLHGVFPAQALRSAGEAAQRIERARNASDGSDSSGQSPSVNSGASLSILLGGERGGVLIEGFDCDNSPLSYTRERVGGKTVIFTTTNGTAALLHAREAAEVLVGSMANVSAVCERVAMDARPVHILCAGTRDEISMDDCLPAGAMVEKLVNAERSLASDDSARFAHLAYRGALVGSGGVVEAFRQSRGGRNLAKAGLGADVEFCATADTLPVVPRFDVARGEIVVDSAERR